MGKKRNEHEPEREHEQTLREREEREQKEARTEPEEAVVETPNPNLHTPFIASGEQHHCGIDHWLEDHAAKEPEAKLEEKPQRPRDELIEEIEPEPVPEPPEPPHRRHKIWDRF